MECKALSVSIVAIIRQQILRIMFQSLKDSCVSHRIKESYTFTLTSKKDFLLATADEVAGAEVVTGAETGAVTFSGCVETN